MCFVQVEGLVEPHRRYVYDGHFTMRGLITSASFTSAEGLQHLFLFNDMIILAESSNLVSPLSESGLSFGGSPLSNSTGTSSISSGALPVLKSLSFTSLIGGGGSYNLLAQFDLKKTFMKDEPVFSTCLSCSSTSSSFVPCSSCAPLSFQLFDTEKTALLSVASYKDKMVLSICLFSVVLFISSLTFEDFTLELGECVHECR